MGVYRTKVTDYGYKEKVSVYNRCISYNDETEKYLNNGTRHRLTYEEMSDYMKQKSDERRLRYYRGKVAELIEIALMNPDLVTVITLTFKEPVTSYNYALAEWQLFLKRLRYFYSDVSLKYICVWEYQRERSKKEKIESGGIFHFHALINIKFIKHSVLEKIWGKGYVWVEQLKNDKKRENTIQYVVKYCTKEVTWRIGHGEDVRGQRFFFTSNNLSKPTQTVLEKSVILEDIVFENMEKMIKDGSYDIRNDKGKIINHVDFIEYKK